MRRPTLIASKQGKAKINQARLEKGWTIDDPKWLREASKILEPDQDWDEEDLAPEYYAVSLSTWKRFLQRDGRVRAEFFKAFCQVLRLNWEDVVNREIYDPQKSKRDLSEAPEVSSNFYGRTEDLNELQRWLVKERCRLVLVHGQGGVGKSALARQLVERVANNFDYIVWRSLDDAPTLQQLLEGLVNFLPKEKEDDRDVLQKFIQYLHQHRCLVVLDDWEAITSSGTLAGRYREGYKDYSDLLLRIGREPHKSCLLLLSRERPFDIESFLESSIRSRRLGPLQYEEAKKILLAEGLRGNEQHLKTLCRRYSNPWILKLVSRVVWEAFDGEVSDILEEASIFVNDVIINFLDEQFKQLSELEKKTIYWLAIRRNTALLEQLRKDTAQTLSVNELINALASLKGGRCLVERDSEGVYTLDLVVLKYINNRFVEINCEEVYQVIQSETIHGNELFNSHSFITSIPQNEPLKNEQIRRIAKPIKEWLFTKLGSKMKAQEELRRIQLLLEESGLSKGYASQNISLLCELTF